MATHSECDAGLLLAQLRTANLDELKKSSLRGEIHEALRTAMLALETPIEAARRVSFGALTLPIVRTGNDLHLFEKLSAYDGRANANELAIKTGADAHLLTRLLSYLATQGLVVQHNAQDFSASETTKAFGTEGYEATIAHHWNMSLPAWDALPQHFNETGYKNPERPEEAAFKLGLKTSLTSLQWLGRHAKHRQTLGKMMEYQWDGEGSWLDVFPSARLKELAEADSTTPLYVDVGSSNGHRCAALLERYPEVKRKVVLQSSKAMLEIAHRARKLGVECTAHDMWTPQPVLGASIYLIGGMLQKFSDDQAAEVLRIQAKAMNEVSVLVVDEMVLPDEGMPHWHAAELDLAMMAALGGTERSLTRWQGVFEKAGLRLQEAMPYSALGHTAMILEAASDRGCLLVTAREGA